MTIIGFSFTWMGVTVQGSLSKDSGGLISA